MSDRKQAIFERVPSGIPGLDTILDGGFLKGGMYIVQGPPGSGKTTLANQVCFHHVTGDAKALYLTLLAEYHARMMLHLGAMSFFDVTKVPDQLAYLNGLRVLHEEGTKGLLTLLRREITARGTSLLVIDGIVAARRSAADEQAFNEFVHELQAVAIATDCTMLILTSAQGVKMSPEHTMVDGIIELSDRPMGWAYESILQVVKFRGSRVLRGLHAFRITDHGIVVHPRIEALLAKPSRPDAGSPGRTSSGIERLDAMLGGGLPMASTTIVMGPSGTGKTTLGLQFLSRCSEAEPGLMMGFYETPVRLEAKIDAVSPPLRQLLDSGVVELQWQPPTDDLLDAFAERMLRMIHRRSIKRLFVDGLGAMQEAAGGEPGRMGNFLTALINELRVLGVTIVFSLEVNGSMGPDLRSPLADLSSLGENLIMLRFIERDARLHRLVSVIKVRDSDFDPALYEYVTSGHGLLIKDSSDSARAIVAGTAPEQQHERVVGELPRERHGR